MRRSLAETRRLASCGADPVVASGYAAILPLDILVHLATRDEPLTVITAQFPASDIDMQDHIH